MAIIKCKCEKCKGYGYYTENVALLYLKGMTCNCGGKVNISMPLTKEDKKC